MTRRLLDFDPLTRESVYFEMKDNVVELTHHQDDDFIIQANKMMANDDEYTRSGIKENWWHYARIPNTVAFKWLKEEGIDIFNREHRKKVFSKLNDPEYRYLKTTRKRHG